MPAHRETSLEKGLGVLHTLSLASDGMTVSNISSTLGYPESTVSRLLQTLKCVGYVGRASDAARTKRAIASWSSPAICWTGWSWVGLENSKGIFGGDRLIGTSFKNTLYYMGFQVLLLIILAFSLALLLNARIRERGAYRTIYYLPSLVPAVASLIIWIFMLRTKNGLIDQALGLVGIEAIPWLSRPNGMSLFRSTSTTPTAATALTAREGIQPRGVDVARAQSALTRG